MNCQTCRAEIEELEAGAGLSRRASAHVRVCPECGAFHEERQALRRLVGSLGPVNAPPDFDFRLRARLAAARTSGNHRASWRTFLASAPAIGLAASFALLVAGFVIYNQRTSSPRAGGPASETVARQPAQEVNPPQGATPAGGEIADAGPAVKVKGENPPAVVRGKTPRAGAKLNQRRDAAGAQQIISNESAALTAEVTTPERRQPVNAGGAVMELPVRPASHPVRVSLDGRDGARRTVTLEPVVFGSQDFAGRSLSRAGAPQDVW